MSRNNVALQVEMFCCTTNFYVAKSRRRFYVLEYGNLLRKKVVIRATNHLNLQRNIRELKQRQRRRQRELNLKISILVIFIAT